MGHTPMAKLPGRCHFCRQRIEVGQIIAHVNCGWFHKSCAVKLKHPTFLGSTDLIKKAFELTTDQFFRSALTSFFSGSGHFAIDCAPGSGKTTFGTIVTQTMGATSVLDLMFNKHNALEAVEKGITHAFTYHGITCASLMRYLRQEVPGSLLPVPFSQGYQGLRAGLDWAIWRQYMGMVHSPPETILAPTVAHRIQKRSIPFQQTMKTSMGP